jgi:hypothetical protein
LSNDPQRVDAVIETFFQVASDRVILVGRSPAGIALPRVAERIPKQLELIIIISCSISPVGQTVIDIITWQIRSFAEEGLKNGGSSVLPDAVA